MSLKNWKVGTRIWAGFAVVILITTVLGIFAYTQSGDVERGAVRITTRSLPQLYLEGLAQRNAQATFALALEYAATTDKQEKAGIASQIKAVRTSNSAILEDSQKLVDTEKGRALNETFQGVRASFLACLDDIPADGAGRHAGSQPPGPGNRDDATPAAGEEIQRVGDRDRRI